MAPCAKHAGWRARVLDWKAGVGEQIMRTALLAAYQTTPEGKLRASLTFAGRSVLGWQIDLAMQLGCERMIVLADQRGPEILNAQHQVEAKGLQFYCLSGFERLPAMLQADDEVLMLADGVIGEPASIKKILGLDDPAAPNSPAPRLKKAVICIPSDAPQASAFPDEFERIDAERCWAGVLLMRAAPVQFLSDFPAESDAISVLLRLALQAKTACVMLTPQQSSADQWLIAHDTQKLVTWEKSLIARHQSDASIAAPGHALAGWIAAAVGVRALGRAGAGGTFAGAVLMIFALVLAWTGATLTAVILAALGSMVFAVATQFSALKSALLGIPEASWLARLRDPGGDALLCVVIALLLTPMGEFAATAALGPLAIGAARLAAGSSHRLVAAFWSDRPLQLVLLVVAEVLGLLDFALAAMALTGVAYALVNSRNQSFPQ